jgi:hypothetical protein
VGVFSKAMDPATKPDYQRLTAAASQPSKSVTYPLGHELGDAATADRDTWLSDQLGL